MNTTMISSGMEVGCRYRWPYDGCHPDCWLPPLKGVVLDQADPRALKGTLAFPCRDGALPDADKVKAHVQRCHAEGLLDDKVPVLYQRVDASGPFIQWDDLDKLLPYADMLADWEKARAEKRIAIERQRQAQIKELRAEIRRTKAEMKERGIKRSSCFNRLETRLKSLVGGDQ